MDGQYSCCINSLQCHSSSILAPSKKIFDSAITTSRGKTLKVRWPPFSLPSHHYYIAHYFQDNPTPSPCSWRVFDVGIKDQKFYSSLNVTTSGFSVYATEWPLSGCIEISLTPNSNTPVGPLINAGEIFENMPLEEKTLTKDGFGFSGLLPPTTANLSALQHLWHGENRFEGPIPDLSNLKSLETLHLENNRFEGDIPESVVKLPKLRELPQISLVKKAFQEQGIRDLQMASGPKMRLCRKAGSWKCKPKKG